MTGQGIRNDTLKTNITRLTRQISAEKIYKNIFLIVGLGKQYNFLSTQIIFMS